MNWEYLILHHTGAEEKDTDQIRRYHLGLGWQDIGYHFVIEREGSVISGRSLTLPGAHCLAGGMNRRGIGIAVIGDLTKHPPLPEQTEALVELLARLVKEYNIPLEHILGHREVPGAETLCPGKYFPLAEMRGRLSGTTRQDADVNYSELWRVQVGAFSTRERADAYAQKLQGQGIDAYVVRAK
ncbi:N-acetylmuramoyl-L-alanine amidase [Desulfolucanica intricata]|uniref:N-acetylmuramoyl-L-alanine amidase n=1 Tax=Desulfolucanica intricata TaxID=1285191 RepID=UPI000834F81B|nr:N-acetylmuramoyl-L-alanine amidase [Desulfolucanica intricata]